VLSHSKIFLPVFIRIYILSLKMLLFGSVSPAVSNHDLWQMLRERVTGEGCEQSDLDFAVLLRF